ncbi:hypothetical protein [Nocardioides limicola]|uniref:hypothetical protein n=1 Tax=Nocardioides limicola TaxID=2803368 RepID=UPI00193B8513|nr:hypothetical protein [Nocardioides sp. DJM-14]
METPLIHTQSDVEQLWRTLMQPLGFAQHALWACMVEADGHAVPHLLEVDDLPPVFTDADADQLIDFLEHVLREFFPGGSVALLLTRPGAGPPAPRDRETAAAVYAAAQRQGVSLEVIHLANDTDIAPVPMDEAA